MHQYNVSCENTTSKLPLVAPPASSHRRSVPDTQSENSAPIFAPTDIGNAERFAHQHASSARYCHQWKQWLIWDGARWARDTKGQVFLKAKETIRSIPDEAQTCSGSKRTELLKWAIKSESSQRVQAMLSLAEKEPGMAVLVEELDANPWLFNVLNGTIDLKTGRLREHDPDDLITKLGGAIFDEEAQCPNFVANLDTVFQGNAALIQYVKRAFGYSLTGVRWEQMILFLLGMGSNGKTLLTSIMLALFGDYGHTIDPGVLMLRRDDRMATGLADCQGKRLLVCSETNDGRRLDEALVKQITGGEAITAERKYENPFTFVPQFQIWFSTNHSPDIRGTDHGIWRRVQLLPFDVRFWDAEKGEEGPAHLQANKGLAEVLLSELPGILQWALQGCLEWQVDGLTTPEEVRNATAQYREDQDIIGAFIKECCDTGEPKNIRDTAKNLYTKYVKYCEDASEPPKKQRSFGDALKERGFVNKTEDGKEIRASNGAAMWAGVALKRDWNANSLGVK